MRIAYANVKTNISAIKTQNINLRVKQKILIINYFRKLRLSHVSIFELLLLFFAKYLGDVSYFDE